MRASEWGCGGVLSVTTEQASEFVKSYSSSFSNRLHTMKTAVALCFALAVAARAAPMPEGATGASPKAEWARAPHPEPATMGKNGRVVLASASGSAEGATGGMDMRMPARQVPIVAPCDDCGSKDNKPEDTHPVIHSVNHVYHPTHGQGGATGAYNATGDYRGEGTPISGVVSPNATKGPNCCRVCAPAKECKHKNACFNVCKRVCGPTCVIPSPPRCVEPPCKKANETATAPWIAPEITQDMKDKVHAAAPEDKVKVIVGLLRGQK